MRRRGPASARAASLVVAAVLAVGLGACKHTEYLYRHEVVGTVVSGAGAPVAGARVIRGITPADTVAGTPDLYARTTDDAGAFAFVYQGLGGEPAPEDTWHLIVTKEGFARQVRTVIIPWTPPGGEGAPGGYIVKDFVITLEPTAEAAGETTGP